MRAGVAHALRGDHTRTIEVADDVAACVMRLVFLFDQPLLFQRLDGVADRGLRHVELARQEADLALFRLVKEQKNERLNLDGAQAQGLALVPQ